MYLVAAACQTFGHFGRVAVPTAIEIRMVAQREEDKAHFLRHGCYLRERVGAIRYSAIGIRVSVGVSGRRRWRQRGR